jgi:hypothetical protein
MTEQAAIYSSSMIQQGDDKEVVNIVEASLGAKLKKWNMAIRNWIYPAHLEGGRKFIEILIK